MIILSFLAITVQSARLTLFLENNQQIQKADSIIFKYTIQTKQHTLKAAIIPAQQSLKQSLDKLKQLAIKKSDIKVSNHFVKPVYKAIRDHTKFYGFFVTYEVEVTVVKPDIIGKLADTLVASNVHQITSIECEDGIITKAISIAQRLCKRFNQRYSYIQLVQPLQKESQQEQGDQQQLQEEQQQEQAQIYKVVLVCK